MNFSKTDRQVADVKNWIRGITAAKAGAMSPGDFQAWIVGQFQNELGPLMEAGARASQAEVGAVYEHIGELDSVVNELMDHEDSYLRKELSEDLVKTLLLGLQMVELIANISPGDDMSKRKLAECMGAYQQASTVMLDMIEQITEEDEDAKPTRSGLHDESGHVEGVNGRGEKADAADGSPSNDGETPRDGTE